MSTKTQDILIIGGGPAGLCAAINGASEGLDITLFDKNDVLGGQALQSHAIENYPGFPEGITGDRLMGDMVRQGVKFDANFVCPINITKIYRDNVSNKVVVLSDDYQEFIGNTAIISIGLSYRSLKASGIGPLAGRGIYYGAPLGKVKTNKEQVVVVVGGANSAGQAVVKLASNPKTRVKLVIRKTIDTQMSQYLIDRIEKLDNVEVCEHTEIIGVHGDTCVDGISYICNGVEHTEDIHCMFILIGAVPKTQWLDGVIELDEYKYIKTWTDVNYREVINEVNNVDNNNTSIDYKSIAHREILPFETSMVGVFAAGDVRFGSTKRIASAVGEGAMCLQMIHKYLGEI